ncbi:MAG: efflux RND transporter permease subunit [Bacteroidales bacterium]|nr:efflux RND transporter permease subunit [Bacteroidales bacterium]
MDIKTFIDRPVLAWVISIFIVLVGLIGLAGLPMEQFPDIAPPTVRISATYTGASAETVQKSVIIPLEESLNGVENMMYMTSTATNTGAATITVYFKQGADADMATVNCQNRVASAQGLLPAEVTQSGVTVRKRQNSTLKIVTLYSPDDSFDADFLTNYMKINIEPRLSRVPGVGEVNIWSAEYAMRIWLDPAKMAAYSLVPSDVSDVLSAQNVESPTGTLGAESEGTFQYVLKYRGRYETEEEYADLVIKALPDGTVLRLGDIARIELGAQSYLMRGSTSGHPSATAMLSQTAGSNAEAIISEVDGILDEIAAELPSGMAIESLMSAKDFLDASIRKIIVTLLETILLVILVVFFFLQNFRSSLIPAITIVVSTLGTFAALKLAGFSLNMLTLYAIVLVIGTVVDNAIVVVEAVQAKFDAGSTSPYQATVDAMEGITTALLTTTLVFMAVFVPVCFMGGTSGVFYTEFGITMAVAVALSLVNALTLSPALCALLMRPHGGDSTFTERFHTAFDRSFSRLVSVYSGGASFFIRRKRSSGLLVVAILAAAAAAMASTKTGLVPQEDMGTINMNVQTAPGSSMEETGKILDIIESRIRDIPQIFLYSKTVGKDARHNQSASAGSFSIRLKPWSERKGGRNGCNAVMDEIYARTADITTASIKLSTQPMINGYGTGSGFELHVQDRKGGSVEDLLRVTRTLIDQMNARPEISRAYTTFDTSYPQFSVEVDAVQCLRRGVSPSAVLSALSGYVGGIYISNLNRFSKLYRVIAQASPEFRMDEESLSRLYVRTSGGEMAPLSGFIRLERVYGAESLSRFNLFSSIAVYGMPADGYSSGQAIAAIREAAAASLPEGYGFEFGGMSREEASAGGTTWMVFLICAVFIYLILCALYESVTIPFAVLLSVPAGMLGSFLAAKLFSLENNIYMQTGLIMQIGLLAKTAILLTEYATQMRASGMGLTESALAAAKVRLRPILMTSATLIIGMVPLAFASGVGANGNRTMGISVIGGMVLGTLALLFIVPGLFVIFQGLQEKIRRNRK